MSEEAIGWNDDKGWLRDWPIRMDEPWEQCNMNQPNPMTPVILCRGISDDIAWELSRGEGFLGAALYGTTFLQRIDGMWEHNTDDDEECRVFYDYREALQHVVEVCREQRGVIVDGQETGPGSGEAV